MVMLLRLRSSDPILSGEGGMSGFSPGNGIQKDFGGSRIKVILGTRCRMVWVGLEECMLLTDNS